MTNLNLNQLLKVEENANLGCKAVSARSLHKALDIGRDFTTWIKKIIGYGFQENADYTVFTQTGVNPKGGRPQVEYIITLEMAKHIAMVQRTEIGMEVRKYFLECEKQLKVVAVKSPQAFVDSLQLTEYGIEKYLPNFLTYKNVDEVLPALLERISAELDKGTIKIGVLNSAIKTSKQVRDVCPRSAQKELMTEYIEQAQAKYDKTLIASLGGTANKTRILEDKVDGLEEEKRVLKEEVANAKTMRLLDFSKRSLIKAYETNDVIQEMIDEEKDNRIVSAAEQSFKDNLKANVKIIVDNTNLSWQEAYIEVYARMGIYHHPTTFKTTVDYIWDNEREFECLEAAAAVRRKYGC